MNSANFRTVTHGQQTFDLLVLRRRRKTLALHVLGPGQPVELRIPLRCSRREAELFLDSRLDWIVESLQTLGERLPVPARYEEGAWFPFLGQDYPLQIDPGRGKPRLTDGVIRLPVSDPADPQKVRDKLHDFYRAECQPVFEDRLQCLQARFPEPVEATGLRVRRMKARWGSCSRRGEICLNTLLIQKPLAAIDLVIVHELCHLKHFHHNGAFYELMGRALPEWRDREALLADGPARGQQLSLFAG